MARACSKGKGGADFSAPPIFQLNRFGSELVAQTNARIPRRDPVDHGITRQSAVQGRENEAVRQTAGLGRVRHTGIEVYVARKPPVHGEREHIDRSGTARGACAGDGAVRGLGEAVAGRTGSWEGDERSVSAGSLSITHREEALPGAVIGADDVEGRRHRISHAGPEDILVSVGEVSV